MEPRTRLDHQPKGKTEVEADSRTSGAQSLAVSLFPFLSMPFLVVSLCFYVVYSFCHQAAIDCFPLAIWKSSEKNSAIISRPITCGPGTDGQLPLWPHDGGGKRASPRWGREWWAHDIINVYLWCLESKPLWFPSSRFILIFGFMKRIYNSWEFPKL